MRVLLAGEHDGGLRKGWCGSGKGGLGEGTASSWALRRWVPTPGLGGCPSMS